MENNYSVFNLKWRDKNDFIEVMCSAFKQDPIFHYFFYCAQTDKQKEKWMRIFFSFMWLKSKLSADSLFGLFIDSNLYACAILETPSDGMKKFQNGLATLLSLPILLYLPLQVIKRINTYMLKSRENISMPFSEYLVMIGVRPCQQGRGIGKTLIKYIIDSNKNKLHAIGIGLDTENNLNIPIYNKLGFRVHDEIEIGQLRIYRMHYPYKQ